VLLPSLLQGLQDTSPIVREPAVKALRDYRSDPNVEKWLRFVAENDQDPGVRKEATKALSGK
jgi:HEAT repeat protein